MRTEGKSTAHFPQGKKKMSYTYTGLQSDQGNVSSGDNRPLRNALQQTEAHLGPEIFL